MRITLLLLSIILVTGSCGIDNAATLSLPPKPSSPEALKKFVAGKSFKSIKAGTVSPFQMDKENPYQWLDEKKDTTTFARNFISKRMQFTLQFVNDSSVIFTDDGKQTAGIYLFDTETGEEEKEGIKLRISYVDTSMYFPGASGPVTLTSTYPVAGADDNSLLLGTPRSFNNRPVVILMKKQ